MNLTLRCVPLAVALCSACGVADFTATPTEPVSSQDEALSSPVDVATLSDFWEGQARWQLVESQTLQSTGWTYGYGAGSHIVVEGGVWYWFHRSALTLEGVTKPAKCQYDYGGTRVRASKDRGHTWGPAYDVIRPTDGTPWDCMATDGDAVYDRAARRWHYLFQCLSSDGKWRGCHLTRDGESPLGAFNGSVTPNPVIEHGQLWRQICNSSSDDCVRLARPEGVGDEGTYQIGRHDDGDYYVTFHGFDGVNGFRGVARTSDFVTFRAAGPGLPTDAIADREDTRRWRESWQGGPVGVGAGAVLQEAGWYYQIYEAMDQSVACIAGQRWDWGMTRSRSLSSTTWEQLPAGNPFLYSSTFAEWPKDGVLRPFACNTSYARLFQDPQTGATYLRFTRESADTAHSGSFLYRLVKSRNLLGNGDLWKCNTEGFSTFPVPGRTTNLVVYRDPARSSDEGCYLATNCGGSSCAGGQSVLQDVRVAGLGLRRVTFGGKFRAEAGAHPLNLVVFQLDASGRVIGSPASVSATVATSYQAVAGALDVAPTAQTLRYQVYLGGPSTLFADELYLGLPSQEPLTFSAARLPHLIGRADGDGWSANVASDAAGFLQFGPYSTALLAGPHTASWELLVDNNTVANDVVVKLDVYDATANVVLATRTVTRREFAAPFAYQRLLLPFRLSSGAVGHAIEARLYWPDSSYVRLRELTLQ